MYYQFPEEYFFPVVIKDYIEFLDDGYRQEEMVPNYYDIEMNEDEVQVDEEYIEIEDELIEDKSIRIAKVEKKEEDVLKEVDEEYVEEEVKQNITSDII